MDETIKVAADNKQIAAGKWERNKDSEKLRAEAYARYSTAGVSLVQELDNILRALAFQREVVEKEMLRGQGFKGETFDLKLVAATKELTLAYSSAVTSKIKLSKHMKDIAEEMTHDEQVVAVKEFIKVMEQLPRRTLLRELTNYHNAQHEGKSGPGMKGPTDADS